MFFFQKTEFDISRTSSPEETICTKCQVLFYEKNKKNTTNLSSAELAQGVVKVKGQNLNFRDVTGFGKAFEGVDQTFSVLFFLYFQVAYTMKKIS